MQSWMTRILKKSDSYNSMGTDDGGLGLSGGLYNIMSHDDLGAKKRKRKYVYKKKRPNPNERPGEQEYPVQKMR